MLQLILGILLIFSPFLFINRFNNKILGFSSILFGIFSIQLAIALITQLFQIFYYPVILIINLIIAFVSVFLFIKFYKYSFNEIKNSIKKIKIKKEYLFFIFALGIIFFQFYSVHFNYTGRVSNIGGTEYVTNSSYTYPSFSDEWVALYAIESSIEKHSLPWNNFFFGKPKQNFFISFHSFLSEIILLLKLDLLTQYSTLVIIFGILLTISIFLVLRSIGASFEISTLTMLLAPYITNGSNLPTFWYLIPWNIGFIVFLLSIIFMINNQKKLVLGSSILSILFYPPIILFSLPSVLIYLWEEEVEIKKKKKFIYIYSGIIFISFIAFILISKFTTGFSFGYIFYQVFDLIIRPLNSLMGVAPKLAIWNIFPIFAIPFAFYGIWFSRKKINYLVVPIIIGLSLWIIYSIHAFTFIADFHRVVAMTSIMMMIFAGIGFQATLIYFKEKKPTIFKKNILTNLFIIILMIFLILSFSYTKREKWSKLKTPEFLYNGQKTIVYPAPPSNRYLHEDDLRIFSNIHNEKFLSPGWKGLILGVMTDNEPLYTKSSTMHIRTFNYDDFMQLPCEGKEAVLQKYKFKYVYSWPINCDNFIKVDESIEGLHLYEYRPRE